MDALADGFQLEAWKPLVPGIREVLHARFTDHAYPLHTHDTWTLFIVDAGRIRYDLDRQPRGADEAMVGVLPPHVAHDGRPATPDGYRKRVLYVDGSVLPERLIGRAVDRPDLRVPGLRSQISALHDRLRCRDDLLDAEARLAFVAERIRAALGDPVSDDEGRIEIDRVAERLRAHLDEHLFEPVTLSGAVGDVGQSTSVLARAFSATFGIPPHRYLIGRRLDAARDLILRGQPLADVAVETGFVDQAHLTRRFRQFLGTTPGRYAGHAKRHSRRAKSRAP